MPAAVVCAIYPTSQILGSVQFPFNSFELDQIRWILFALLLAGMVVAAALRSWIALALFLPGVLLLFTAPDRLGAVPVSPGHFNPEIYNAEEYSQRLDRLSHGEGTLGFLWDQVPSLLLRPDEVKKAIADASSSVEAWRESAGKNKEEIEKLEKSIAAKKKELDARAKRSGNSIAGAINRAAMTTLRNDLKKLEPKLTALVNERDGERSRTYSEAISASANAETLLQRYERQLSEKEAFINSLPYFVAASIAFAWILWSIGFRNTTMALLLLVTLAASMWVSWPAASAEWSIQLPKMIYPFFSLVIAAVAMRFVFRAIKDNAAVVREFPRTTLLQAGLRAFLAWLPFVVAIGAVLWLSSFINRHIEQAIYCDSPLFEWCANETNVWVTDSDPSRDTLRDDLQLTVQRKYAEFEASAVGAAGDLNQATSEGLREAQARVMQTFNSIVPKNTWDFDGDLMPPTCSWLHLKCQIRRAALTALNKAYQRPRDRAEARLNASLTKIVDVTTTAAASSTKSFGDAIRGESQAAALATNQAIDAGFLVWSALTMLKNTTFLLVAIRGLLLIFARTLYRGNDEERSKLPYLALTHTEPPTPRSDLPKIIRSKDSTLELPSGERLLLNRRFEATNAPPESLLFPPMVTRWFFARVLNRCLWLKRIPPDSGKRELTDSEGAQFVMWEVPAGRQIGFRWDTFVGMSESARLEKTISLRFGTLVLGRVMLPSVRGPGVLIQKTFGKPEETHGVEPQTSFAPARLLSWLVGTTFQMVPSNRMSSVYLDDCHIEARKNGFAIFDAAEVGGSKSNVLREFLRLFRLW